MRRRSGRIGPAGCPEESRSGRRRSSVTGASIHIASRAIIRSIGGGDRGEQTRDTTSCHPWWRSHCAPHCRVRFCNHHGDDTNRDRGPIGCADPNADGDTRGHAGSDGCAHADACPRGWHRGDVAQRWRTRADPRRPNRKDSLPLQGGRGHDLDVHRVVRPELAAGAHCWSSACPWRCVTGPARNDETRRWNHAGDVQRTSPLLLHRRHSAGHGRWRGNRRIWR